MVHFRLLILLKLFKSMKYNVFYEHIPIQCQWTFTVIHRLDYGMHYQINTMPKIVKFALIQLMYLMRAVNKLTLLLVSVISNKFNNHMKFFSYVFLIFPIKFLGTFPNRLFSANACPS